jgi:hypothetical protein
MEFCETSQTNGPNSVLDNRVSSEGHQQQPLVTLSKKSSRRQVDRKSPKSRFGV